MRLALPCLLALLCVRLTAATMPVGAPSFIAIEAASGAVLFERDADAKRFPASTTKIMTALLLLERCKLTDKVTAPKDCMFVGESSMHLEPGEEVTVKDLLYCILLRSANDGCQIAAIHVSGSEGKFAQEMNKRAEELGCENTNFVNPHGLHDKNHYTSARDLARIAKEAMQYEAFREIVATRKHRIERSVNQEDRWMVNHNKLLRVAQEVDGIKTGWTKPAGKCFVGSARSNEFRVITVVLGSDDWQTDTMNLIHNCFLGFERPQILPSRHETGRAGIQGGAQASVGLLTGRPAYALQRKGTKADAEMKVIVSTLQAPVKEGQEIGRLRVMQNGKVVDEVPLVAARAVEARILPTLPWQAWILPTIVLMALALRARRAHV